MSAQLYRLGRLTGEWTNSERAELHAVLRLIRAAGQDVELEEGVSDEGDPWCVFCHSGSGEVIAHVARIEGRYVLDSVAFAQPLTGRSLRECATRFIDEAPLPPPRVQESGILRLHPGALLAGLFLTLTMFVQARIEPVPFDAEAGDNRPELSGGVVAPVKQIAQQLLDLFQAALRGERHVDAGTPSMVPVAAIMAGVAIVDIGSDIGPPDQAQTPAADAPPGSAEELALADDDATDVMIVNLGDPVEVAGPQDDASVRQVGDGDALVDGDHPGGAEAGASARHGAAIMVDSPPQAAGAIPASLDEAPGLDEVRERAGQDGRMAARETTEQTADAVEIADMRLTTTSGSDFAAVAGSGDWRSYMASTEAGAVVDAVIFRDDGDMSSGAPASTAAIPDAVPVAAAAEPPAQRSVDPDIAALVFQFVQKAKEIYIIGGEKGIFIYDTEIIEGFDRGKHVVREIVFADDSVITLTGFEADFGDVWV